MEILVAKAKAKELVDSFRKDAKLRSSGFLVANEDTSIYHSKRCALISIQDQIKFINSWTIFDWSVRIVMIDELRVVKHEIQKL